MVSLRKCTRVLTNSRDFCEEYRRDDSVGTSVSLCIYAEISETTWLLCVAGVATLRLIPAVYGWQ